MRYTTYSKNKRVKIYILYIGIDKIYFVTVSG